MQARSFAARVRTSVMLTVAALILSVAPGVGVPSVAATATAPPLAGPFSVTGRSILDGNGQPVVFKGVVRDGPQMWRGPTGPTPHAEMPSLAELDHLKSWGANLLRLPLSEDLWNGATDTTQRCANEDYDTAYRTRVIDVVNAATARGMFLLLELNFTNPGCLLHPGNNKGLNGGASRPLPGPGAIPFWDDLAALFGSNPLVGFEPYNEPHVCAMPLGPDGLPQPAQSPTSAGCPQAIWINDDANTRVWAEGGLVAVENGATYEAIGMRTLVERIRARTDNLIFLDANSYANDPYTFISVGMFDAPNLVYAGHVYPCSTAGCTTATTSASACATVRTTVEWFTYWANRLDPHPIVFNEFGWPNAMDPTTPNEVSHVVDNLNSIGVGWAAFSFGTPYVNYPSPYALRYSAQPGPDDATSTGRPVKQAMQGAYANACRAAAPSAPTSLAVTAIPNGATVSWTVPPDAASDATLFRLTYTSSKRGAPSGALAIHCMPVANRCTQTVSNLAGRTKYSFALTASNSHGSSQATKSVTVTTL